MRILHYQFISILISYQIDQSFSNAISINTKNIDLILASNEFVFINFYANWCRFSQILQPIYDQLANQVNKEYSKTGQVLIGKIDCDQECKTSLEQSFPSSFLCQVLLAKKYHVNKYPTLKYSRHGILSQKEYRGARQFDALMNFIREQLQSPIIPLLTSNDLNTLEKKNQYIIGYFHNQTSDNYQIFSKVAHLLRDQCHFAASTDPNLFAQERQSNDLVYFRSSESLNEKDEYYHGLINNEQLFYSWSHKKCLRLVREITFENAEELTDEGLPFLILFHHINDQQSLGLFEQQVAQQLIHQTSTINCLHADGEKFSHPLEHLGKSSSDLPLLVIDSFEHMFLFPNIQFLSIKGKLLEFVQDFHSGKLHQDFHQTIKDVNVHLSSKTKTILNEKSINDSSLPPRSVFIHLSPSRQRYSFRDEL